MPKISPYKKYTQGTFYDSEAGEWIILCSACGKTVYSPTHALTHKIRLQHTRSKDCLNGY